MFDYNGGGGGAVLDTYRSRISKIIHMHLIFLMTVVIQPLSICQNKLDSSFFSLIIIYNSAEAIVLRGYCIIITELKFNSKCDSYMYNLRTLKAHTCMYPSRHFFNRQDFASGGAGGGGVVVTRATS